MSVHSIRKKLNCILLIDDDPATNFLHKLIIEQARIAHEIRIVYNGQEAMDYLTRQNEYQDADDELYPLPDLMFLDINMPVMDGWEFLDAYEEAFLDLPKATVICMLSTALPKNVESRLKEKSIPVTNFIEKPLRKDRLLQIMEKFFPERFEKA
ncbi:response regulator [Flavilitoribacter nigricans]|uniref:Response regulator n=1 Tax=Flavilitoribacter nigricans (strain ATCC 23147 / DSM 23189 / NBRC 102662 / NCIMB 1420 / SS-2) TaxID=1122177 RepID=A0A2D0NJI3_FLAN2|nr:response regulator [Flavilitoribacter nigricans]PHN07893.1 response regulator [Flavilitoribacter nigricans DSM 23189 = NBRC 102662]